jgi:hypothetical protein
MLVIAVLMTICSFSPAPGSSPGVIARPVLPQCYIYGYLDNFIIAEILNAASNEAAYGSFEDNAPGNWTFTAGGVQVVAGKKSITGNKFYSLSSGNITKSFSPAPGKNMIVSYWSRSGVQTVNGSTSGQAGRAVTIDGFTWTFYEHVLTTPTSITISGTGLVDEVRLHPEDATMKSYTYEPTVGVTASCDGNNNITYNEYDIFKRLTLVRDADYRIIKKWCYGNAGEVENCTGQLFYSVVKSGNFQRTNCGGGYSPGSITYTVPAGTYVSSVDQATADAMAQNDVNVNGPVYSNIDGACNIVYNSPDYSGNYQSNSCPPGETPLPIYVSVPYGMFTSIVSQFDANNQALTYAQNYANQNGQCQADVLMTYDNWAGGPTFYVYMINLSTSAPYYFEISSAGSGLLGSVPAGDYNIEITNSAGQFGYLYEAGCSPSTSAYPAYFYGIQINSGCSQIRIY